MSALSMLSLNFFLNVATDVDDFKGLFRSFQILTDLYANERCPETLSNFIATLAIFYQVPVHTSKIRSDSYLSGKSWTIRHFTLFQLFQNFEICQENFPRPALGTILICDGKD